MSRQTSGNEISRRFSRGGAWSAALSCLLLAAAGAATAQDRFKPSADGQEISDSRTGLTWRRCAEGMVFKGKACTGQPVYVSQIEATSRAKSAAPAEGTWRLPVLKELSSLVAAREAEEGRAAIDPVAFPNTPVGRFWTASSSGAGYFSYVGFADGSAGETTRTSPGAVRLVRGGE